MKCFPIESSKAALTKLDEDEYIEVIKMVPLHERKWRVTCDSQCSICDQVFDCSCRLRRHFENYHHQERKLGQWNYICPFCLCRLTDKCTLLQHIYSEHKERQKHLAGEALRERGHFEEHYKFNFVGTYCPSCDFYK